jgi:hypothetical protein
MADMFNMKDSFWDNLTGVSGAKNAAQEDYNNMADTVNQQYDLGQKMLSDKLTGLGNKRNADLTVQLGRQGNLNGGIAEGARNQITQGLADTMETGTNKLTQGRTQTLANLKLQQLQDASAREAQNGQVFGNIMKTIGTIGGAIVGGVLTGGAAVPAMIGAGIGGGVGGLFQGSTPVGAMGIATPGMPNWDDISNQIAGIGNNDGGSTYNGMTGYQNFANDFGLLQ